MSHEIPIFCACLLASGFFSGSETALLTAGRLRLRRLANDGDLQAADVLRLIRDPRRLLAGILVGNNIVNILAAVVAGSYFAGIFEKDPGLAAIAATASATPLLVLFSEFLPKTVAALHPISFSRRVVRPVRFSIALLWPLVFVLELLTRPLGALLSHKKDAFGFVELQTAIGEGVRQGAVDETMARIMRGGLLLERKTAEDVLVPRVDVAAIDGRCGYEECLAMFQKERYSRLLVMNGSPDADAGYLAIKDLTLLAAAERETWTATRGAREALRVHSSMPLSDLLGSMRRSGRHFAVVKDEYGGTEGIVTLEDVLEELVGEIRDEHDEDELAPVRQLQANTWVVRGDVNVQEFAGRYGLPLASVDAKTMGGLVAEALGRVPRQGETVELDGVRLLIARVKDNRVHLVRVVRL